MSFQVSSSLEARCFSKLSRAMMWPQEQGDDEGNPYKSLLMHPVCHEVGGQRVSSTTDSAERFHWVSRPIDISARSVSDRFQPPLPEPCRPLSRHTALQGGSSTGIGLLRHPPHPLGSVHLPLRPFTLSWALPQAFDYYDRSAPIRLSPVKESHRLTSTLLRP